jgi:PAP2 superfamily
MRRQLVWAARACAWLLAMWAAACAAGFDHRIAKDESGIWSRGVQNFVYYGAIATEIGGAAWFGGEDKLGRTFWESIDSSVLSGVTAEVAKRAFGRRRPAETADPNDWWNGSCCKSFPSGEVTLQASFVTPFIVNYASDHPWVWALEVLPAYDAIARVKSQAHWQTDVLAGWALGTGFGYWAAKRNSPLFLQIMPHGVAVGIQTRF